MIIIYTVDTLVQKVKEANSGSVVWCQASVFFGAVSFTAYATLFSGFAYLWNITKLEVVDALGVSVWVMVVI